MLVIATGPRSNGTTLLYRILASGGGKTPLHLPAYPPEFREQDWATDFPASLFVVVIRDPVCAARSMVARGFHATEREAMREQVEAQSFLYTQMGKLSERAFRLYYESLVKEPDEQVARIDSFLRFHGYSGDPLTHEPIRDENAKWLSTRNRSFDKAPVEAAA